MLTRSQMTLIKEYNDAHKGVKLHVKLDDLIKGSHFKYRCLHTTGIDSLPASPGGRHPPYGQSNLHCPLVVSIHHTGRVTFTAPWWRSSTIRAE